VFTRVSVLLVFAVGLYFSFRLLCNLCEDTTPITNIAFAITASISALSFACARAIKGPNSDKDRFVYAGERYFHAGIMLICASILKYFFISIKSNLTSHDFAWFVNALGTTTGIFVTVLFYYALAAAHGGLIVLNKLLWSRFNRYPEWDDLI
jgi:hypothetical protein